MREQILQLQVAQRHQSVSSILALRWAVVSWLDEGRAVDLIGGYVLYRSIIRLHEMRQRVIHTIISIGLLVKNNDFYDFYRILGIDFICPSTHPSYQPKSHTDLLTLQRGMYRLTVGQIRRRARYRSHFGFTLFVTNYWAPNPSNLYMLHW